MDTLKDFLKTQAESHQAFTADARAKREEWIDSASFLIGRLTDWLHKADQENILELSSETYVKREEGIGFYRVDGLNIRLLDREVRVVPVARNVVGTIGTSGAPRIRAQGRVDLTDGGRKYMLYRVIDDQGERWVLVDDRDYSTQELDEQSFGVAVKSLLE